MQPSYIHAHYFSQVDELKTAPADGSGAVAELSAPDIVAKELDKELKAAPSGSAIDKTKVNDLTTVVKKKKKDVNGNAKRKADDDPLLHCTRCKNSFAEGDNSEQACTWHEGKLVFHFAVLSIAASMSF